MNPTYRTVDLLYKVPEMLDSFPQSTTELLNPHPLDETLETIISSDNPWVNLSQSENHKLMCIYFLRVTRVQ